jgi:large subunit ribosomal protein L10
MYRAEKAALIEAFKDTMSRAESVVLTEFNGLTVAEATSLRRSLSERGVHFMVIKNTLAKRAIDGTDMSVLSDRLTGPTAWAWSEDDPVAPAKVLSDLLKGDLEKHLTIKLGYLDGRALDEAEVIALSKLPGRDELRAQLLSVFLASGTQLVRVLAARPVEFLRVLKARSADLEEAA